MSNGFTDHDVPDLAATTMLVTGANTGLGFEASKVLASRGARVLLACRSEEKARTAMDRIAADVVNADLAFVPLDQADLASVAEAAEIVNGEERLDVLVNNAGIMVPPLQYTIDGFESQFGVNHLGTFALTAQLLSKLAERAGSSVVSPRVVVTSSIAHKGARIFWDDIGSEESYGAQDRYGQSKLANLLFVYELDRRLRAAGSGTTTSSATTSSATTSSATTSSATTSSATTSSATTSSATTSNIEAVGCHPGLATTELTRHMPSVVRFAMPLLRPFFNSAAQGAWPTLMAATSPDVEGGDYVGPSKRGATAGPAVKVGSTATSRDDEQARRLWDLSIEMTGVDPGL